MRRLTILLALVGPALLSTSGVAVAAGEPPRAIVDSYTVEPGKKLQVPARLGVLANDLDPEGERLTAILGQAPPNGSLKLWSNGAFSYTPSQVGGTDAFSYSAFDGTTLSDPVFVFIRVDAVPVAVSDTFRFLRPGPVTIPAPGVLANDQDTGGDPLYAELGKKTIHGGLQLHQDGSFVYSPGSRFRDRDSFTYRAFDGMHRSKMVRVQLIAVAANAAPVGQPDLYSAYENSPIDVPAPGVLSNDTDADGDPLRAELLGEPGPFDNFEFRSDGSFFLQPLLDWDTDFTFRYRVTDGIAYSDPVTITIDMIAVNNPPIGEDDYYEFDRTQGNLVVAAPGVLANDYDPVEFDSVRVFDLVSGPGHGQLTLRIDGSFTYTPESGFLGTDVFTYRPGDTGPAAGNVTGVTIVVTDGGP